MYLVKKHGLKLAIILTILTSFIAIRATYISTRRDTREPPEEVTYTIEEPEELEVIHETDDLKFFYRESRDTIAVYDKRNGYTWKTGLDIPFGKEIDDVCDDIIDEYEEQFEFINPSVFGPYEVSNNTDATLEVLGFYGELTLDIKDLTEEMSQSASTFSLSGLELDPTKSYRLSFDMAGYDARPINVQLGSFETTVQITDDIELMTYEFEFNPATASNDATLVFNLGTIDGEAINTSLTMDNLKFEELSDENNEVLLNQIERGDFELIKSELSILKSDLEETCIDVEARLNTIYTGFANSLVTVEYFNSAYNIKRISSASYEGASSQLKLVNNDTSHYRLDVEFTEIDLSLKVHIYFDNNGIQYEIKDEDIIGDDTNIIASIVLTPFMGASGGAYETFDVDELDYGDEEIFKYRIPGYTFVPDGSGALLRYNDNDVNLERYQATVYGSDPSLNVVYNQMKESYVPFKQPTLPVFGMAHGNNQAAFVAYASSADEYMQIVSMPEDNLTYYNFTYPRFELNKQYLQVYNKSGDGFLTLYDDRHHYDITMRYDFLSGEGDSHSANYVGMAKRYREYLIETGQLTENNVAYNDVPLRLDFLMSDSEKAITGYNTQVATTTTGVDEILSDVTTYIPNINAGLLGWNDGGITLGDTGDIDFDRRIGSKNDFESLITNYSKQNIDISFSDNYYLINREMMSLRRNAAQHTSTWYTRIETEYLPISTFYYARPTRSVEWLKDHATYFMRLGATSHSVSGITTNLITDYTFDQTRTDSKQAIVDGFTSLPEELAINAARPNMYLLQFTNRYLDMPVYNTQFLTETDTVPFLQLVLQNTMELYGPYSNFSFYTQQDVLRMIDYNISPSFVLTKEPSYVLNDTNSKNFYSTEYTLYEELIQEIYNQVNEALRHVINSEWINREVLESGVILNTYDNGTQIIINYTENSVIYEQTTVPSNSYKVVGE